MEAARRMKSVLEAPDEVPEVLKALISSGGGVPHLIDASTRKMTKEYTMYWGSKYAYWRERLFRAVKAVAQDPIIKEAEISISLSPVGRDGKPEGVSGSFNWKVQRLFHPFKYENKWALLVSKSFTEICAGPLILNVLEAFHVWKVNITEQSPFEFCFKSYYNQLTRGFEAFFDEETGSEVSLDNEMKIVDFSVGETESEDSLEIPFNSESDNEAETKSEDFPDKENGEKMGAARRMKDALGVSDEVTEVLKALISTGDDVPCLIDASTEEMKQVSIDVLKNKYVLLFFSRVLPHCTEFIDSGVWFARGIVENDLLELVWLPIESWNDETEDCVMQMLSRMPWYIVQYFSPIAGVELMKELGLNSHPTLVMLNPQGDMLGKHEVVGMPRILPILPREKEEGWRMKKHFQAPDEITAVLKALLSGSSDVPLLDDCSTEEMKQVSIEVLREKFVLLLISGLGTANQFGWSHCQSVLSSIYDGIFKKELVKFVWIPIVEQWTDELQGRFEMLRSQMPYYSVQCVSTVAGLKFIKEEWFSSCSPSVSLVLVLMSPQGNVLSRHRMSLMIKLSGGAGGPHQVQDYTFCWRTSNEKWLDGRKRNKTWGDELSELAEKVARDPIITGKNISIKWHCFKSRRELRRSFGRKARSNWAALVGPERSIICEGPQILHVLRAFESWKDDVRLNPFGYCFENRYKELVDNVPASRRR